MLWTTPKLTGEVVLSKGEHGYREVIDSFDNANSVTVVTYNLSSEEDDELLGALKNVHCQARLITRIPNRFERYTSEWARRRAKDTIASYLRRLSPDLFGPSTRVSFCFSNHAKVVATDKIGYVGSSNYSVESGESWEMGIILRDPTALAEVAKLVDEIERDSVRFYGPAMSAHVTPLLAAHGRLLECHDRLRELFTTADMEEFEETVVAIRDVVTEADRAWAEAAETTGPICSRIDMNVVQNLEDWYGARSAVWDLAEANKHYQDAVDGDIDSEELALNNDGEVIDSAQDDLIDERNTTREGLELEVREEMTSVLTGIETLSTQIEGVCKDISSSLGRIKNAG